MSRYVLLCVAVVGGLSQVGTYAAPLGIPDPVPGWFQASERHGYLRVLACEVRLGRSETEAWLDDNVQPLVPELIRERVASSDVKGGNGLARRRSRHLTHAEATCLGIPSPSR